jgi:hypothetical protein
MHVLVGLSFSQDGDYHCFTVLYTQYHILSLAIIHTVVTQQDTKGMMQKKWEKGHLYQHNYLHTKSHIVDAETKPGSRSDHCH